jgi:hypothetical protein
MDLREDLNYVQDFGLVETECWISTLHGRPTVSKAQTASSTAARTDSETGYIPRSELYATRNSLISLRAAAG